MELTLIKLLFNTGLLILIWIVQLVIYPSFLYYTEQNLTKWHAVYTQRFTIVVLPLMLGQLLLYGYSLFENILTLDVLIFSLVIFNWAITFLWAVPLHNKVQDSKNSTKYRERLVSMNWFRTIAWSLIFLISLTPYYAK